MAENSMRMRMCLIGSLGSGKTSLRLRLCGEPFKEKTKVTIACQSRTVYLTSEQTPEDYDVKLFIDDTSGEERFRNAVTLNFVRHAQCVLLCFDLSSQESLESAKHVWFPWLWDDAGTDAEVIMVGLKADLPCAVDSQAVQNWALQKGMKYYQTSSRTGDGLSDLSKHIGSYYKRLHLTCFSLSISEDGLDTLLQENPNEKKKTASKSRRKCNC